MAANKAAIIGGLFAVIIVAGAVVAAVILIDKKNSKNVTGNNIGSNNINPSQKAIQDLCQNTYYQKTCIDSLTRASNSSDLKTLIQAGFKEAVKELDNVIQRLHPLEVASEDPAVAFAYKACQKFLYDSINDLQRTFDRTDVLNNNNFLIVIDDLKTWLSGALTYQETCQDRFEDVKGEAGKQVKEFLQQAREITVNGLAMTNQFSTILEQTGLSKSPGSDGEISGQIKLGSLENNGAFSLPPGALLTHELIRTNPKDIKPNVVVAKDGSGKYTTINDALSEVPVRSNNTFVIYVKEGVYKEYVNITSAMWSVMLIGDGPTKTKITGNLSSVYLNSTNNLHKDTYWTSTVVVEGDNFIGRDIGFENTAGGAMKQAVALLVAADKAILYNCQIDGYQDTLCTHAHRQFYRDCTITGTVDFVFGNARAVMQNCTFVVRKPLERQACMVTAQGRLYDNETTGIVLQSSKIIPAIDYPLNNITYKTYLGRPWKNASRTIVMDSEIDGVIDPAGWLEWNGRPGSLNSCWYAEVNNEGPGANQNGRVKAAGIKLITSNEALDFTPGKWLSDYWVTGLGIPYIPGRFSRHE